MSGIMFVTRSPNHRFNLIMANLSLRSSYYIICFNFCPRAFSHDLTLEKKKHNSRTSNGKKYVYFSITYLKGTLV